MPGKAHSITVVTVNWRSVPLISRMMANLLEKAAAPEALRFLIVDNGRAGGAELADAAKAFSNVEVLPVDSSGLKRSWSHAYALNCAMVCLDTPYTLVIDPDIHVFLKNWDSLLTGELRSMGAMAAGAPYPPWKTGKYHDFPSPPFALFDTRALLEMNSDWTPGPPLGPLRAWQFAARQAAHLGILCSRQRLDRSAALRGIALRLEKVFGVCAPDTGWRVAEAARARNYRSILFDVVWLDRPPVPAGMDEAAWKTLATEFELYCYKGKPAITHRYSTNSPLWMSKRGADNELWLESIKRLEIAAWSD